MAKMTHQMQILSQDMTAHEMRSEKWSSMATAFGTDFQECPYFWDIESRLELSQAYCSASEARIGTGG